MAMDCEPGPRPVREAQQPEPEAELLRATERERLRALGAADLEVANRLHAADFQLITPSGLVLSKEQYLGGIASGHFNYRVWEPESELVVRLYGQVALIRYRSRLHMSLDGAAGTLGHYWHTDSYEQRDGRWQVVWLQATMIE